MTQSEEIVTLKGESLQELQSIYLYNRSIQMSCRSLIANRKQLEVRLSAVNANQQETFQMVFVLKGKLQICHAENRSIVSELLSHQHNLFRLPFKSSALLMNQNDEIISINLQQAFLEKFIPNHQAYKQIFENNDLEAPSVLALEALHITPEMNDVLMKLRQLSASGFTDQLHLESKVIELFALQVAQFEQFHKAEPSTKLKKSEVERMQEARGILINQSGEPLSLRSLAHLVGTNEFNLKRDFKALFGKTVFTYLNHHKMEMAKSMITEQDITIAEISKKIGYKHATHFTSAFKKYFGYLPNKLKSGKLSMLIFLEDFISISQEIVLGIV